MSYQKYKLTTLAEVLGDLIVYRNLAPADRRIPSANELLEERGLAGSALPRKSESSYGRVVAEMLRRARALTAPGSEIQRLIYIGDTPFSDGAAFHNLCAAGSWPGRAFIGRDTLAEPASVTVEETVTNANRWSTLAEFIDGLQQAAFPLDQGTVLVIDIDKTFIGARGRNDKVIDQARVDGVRHTVADLLGDRFDLPAFRAAYDRLNQATYHPFTADNQDYLAYICLILGAGLYQLEPLCQQVEAGQIRSFVDFIGRVNARRAELEATGLAPVHDQVWQCVQAADPTPFKAFRFNEYLFTSARFGDLPDASLAQLLAERIVITQEVRETALALREQGVLVFGVSDKPDEASLPSAEQAARGSKPLHQLETWAVGAK